MSCPSCMSAECVGPECVQECPEESIRVSVDLPCLPAAWSAQVTIRGEQACLADVVPLARAVADRLMGSQAPPASLCVGKGRAMTALSIPEAFCIAREIQQQPDELRNEIAERFAAAARAMIACPPPHDPRSSGSPESLWQWYVDKDIPCPLKGPHGCLMPESRPIACRLQALREAGRDTPRVDEALAELAASMEERPVDGVLLPMLLVWLRQNIDRHHRTWAASQLVERFLQTIRQTA